ncbi:AlbA family DNA-binding domain-containing protein [Pseudarthrobacter sp. J1738]|uniref:AlbA family DNA-binding domain-containing protein n=1 Tax=Pseudarthrobacter sp. J1738 TaxID=3420446 RepID=UPI003D2AF302
MSTHPGDPVISAISYQDRVSREALEQFLHVRGEGDEWDFKRSLGDLADASARVNLAKDVLAFCNLPTGGTLVIGVADDYTRMGLDAHERMDTTAIRAAIEKYIDGDFTVLAAEHQLLPDEGVSKRFGIVYLRRRSSQPVLAALDGHVPNQKKPLFRSGDILIRRGAASIRANSGDVRRLLTSSVVHEEKVRSVNELWRIVVEQRRLVSGVEFLYDILADSEYPEVPTRPELSSARSKISLGEYASMVDDLQLRVSLLRPHLPTELYQQYRLFAVFLGRVQMKAIRQRDAGIFVSWTDLDDGSPDRALHQVASQLLSRNELDDFWTGQVSDIGTLRPIRPAIDATEHGLLSIIDRVLSGLA